MSANPHVHSDRGLKECRDYTVRDDIVAGARDHQIKRLAIKMCRAAYVLSNAVRVEKGKKLLEEKFYREKKRYLKTNFVSS